MKSMKCTYAGLLALALSVGACGVDSPYPGPASSDGLSEPQPSTDLGAPPADTVAAQNTPPPQCPALAGTWKGTIEGKANTFLQNVQMTGTVTMIIAAGDKPTQYKLVSLNVEAWSPSLPMFKVPLKTLGAQSFPCNAFKVVAPIEAQGKKGHGTITGQCSGTLCTGTFQGKTDDGTMDASGKFRVTRS